MKLDPRVASLLPAAEHAETGVVRPFLARPSPCPCERPAPPSTCRTSGVRRHGQPRRQHLLWSPLVVASRGAIRRATSAMGPSLQGPLLSTSARASTGCMLGPTPRMLTRRGPQSRSGRRSMGTCCHPAWSAWRLRLASKCPP